MAAFSGWAASLLHAIGAPVTAQNMRALLAWQRAEGGSASFNPLNTTQRARGASNYNGVGVKNYGSAKQGIQATAQTLLNGHYGNIVGLLRSGHATAEQVGTAVAHSPWGTGGGVLRVLGSGPVPVPAAGGAHGSTPAPHPSTGADPGAMKALVASYLLENAQNTLEGHAADGAGLLGLAIARRQLQAAQQAHGPMSPPVPHQRIAAQDGRPGSVAFIGNTKGLNGSFVAKLQGAVASVGGTKVRIISGYRSPQHNAAVGGVPNSNHITGHAMDGEVFIPGRGWVPLGVALQGVAGKHGLRSGNQPGFYHGGLDPNHVDDGFNQH